MRSYRRKHKRHGDGADEENVIYVITNAYPFRSGEQFLEDELVSWSYAADRYQLKIVLLPLCKSNIARAVPTNLVVDDALTDRSILGVALSIICAAFSFYFWADVKVMFNHGRAGIGPLLRTLNTVAKLQRTSKRLERLLDSDKYVSVRAIYSYWNEYGAYAAAHLKRSNKTRLWFLCTRAHGYDVYEERRVGSHMPLKRQFVNTFDKIFAISMKGLAYLSETYAVDRSRLDVAKLGIEIPASLAPVPDNDALTILSIGSVIHVKRIDRIVTILGVLTQLFPKKRIVWKHIGSGNLIDDIMMQTHLAFDGISNVEVEFLGHLERNNLLETLSRIEADVCLNTSDSEGVPVSLMEAMSFGIPVIAPDIGGISELIPKGIDFTVSPGDRGVDETIQIIGENLTRFRDVNFRSLFRAHIIENYNSETNYSHFIQTILRESNISVSNFAADS